MVWAVNRTGALESSGALRLRVALLPVGHDPDTFLRTSGAAAFEERIGAARSLLSYALDRTIADPEGAKIGRASCRERVESSVVGVESKRETTTNRTSR